MKEIQYFSVTTEFGIACKQQQFSDLFIIIVKHYFAC